MIRRGAALWQRAESSRGATKGSEVVGGGEAVGVARRRLVAWGGSDGPPEAADDDELEGHVRAFTRAYAVTLQGRELIDDATRPTLSDVGVLGRCVLAVWPREEIAPKRGHLGSLPEAWRRKAERPSASGQPQLEHEQPARAARA